jgi:hypothetical protein
LCISIQQSSLSSWVVHCDASSIQLNPPQIITNEASIHVTGFKVVVNRPKFNQGLQGIRVGRKHPVDDVQF